MSNRATGGLYVTNTARSASCLHLSPRRSLTMTTNRPIATNAKISSAGIPNLPWHFTALKMLRPVLDVAALAAHQPHAVGPLLHRAELLHEHGDAVAVALRHDGFDRCNLGAANLGLAA